MKIPKEFKLFGQTIQVEYNGRLVNDTDTVGQAIYRENKIILQKDVKGVSRNQEMTEQTFLHELFHFILYLMSKGELKI